MSVHGRCESHGPCPQCGSRDNLAVYTDGYSKCFSVGCGYWAFPQREKPSDSTTSNTRSTQKLNPQLIENLSFKALPKRALSQESCERWNYGIGIWNGTDHQIATYRNSKGEAVCQKVRGKDKSFSIVGNTTNIPLYGIHLWKPGGKQVVITEGEIDAISVSQLWDHKWPVVSIPTGCKGAANSLRQNLEWLESFERVILCFDMDKPGRDAVNECAELLTPGKCFVAELPLKDANEMLKAGRGRELQDRLWQARPYRPDGIIEGGSITAEGLTEQAAPGYSLPYTLLQGLTRGVRKGEFTLVTAGTGIGKSTWVREIGYHLRMKHGLRIANVFLEENYKKTAQGYAAIHNDIPLGELRSNPKALSLEVLKGTLKDVVDQHMYFYDHFGSLESETLLAKLKYCAVGLGVDFILLDHISIITSGMASSTEGERKDIDILMTRLRSLIEQTGVGIIGVVHLKKMDGTSHEEGGEISLNDLRGSGSLKQIPDAIWGLERNQQGEDSCLTMCRVLKNREWGDTGLAGCLRYHPKTGRLLHTEEAVPSKDNKDSRGFPPVTEY